MIWRSASLNPPYAKHIAAAGFDVRCLQRASDGYMDRVNMYSRWGARVGGGGKGLLGRGPEGGADGCNLEEGWRSGG